MGRAGSGGCRKEKAGVQRMRVWEPLGGRGWPPTGWPGRQKPGQSRDQTLKGGLPWPLPAILSPGGKRFAAAIVYKYVYW